MRRDVQEIFRLTPHEKQCMMFSATLSKEIRPVCRKFMQDVSPNTLLQLIILMWMIHENILQTSPLLDVKTQKTL